MEGNVLKELVREPGEAAARLDLLFVNRERLAGDVIAGGCLGHSTNL